MNWCTRAVCPTIPTRAFVSLTMLLTACGQNPSFTEGDPKLASDLSSPANEHSTPSTESPSEDSVAAPYGSDGVELPPNLLAATDYSLIQSNSEVDILWIVDSSGSMSEEQSYLGQNFSSFLSQLLANSTDFQVGVTSTDICSSTTPSSVPLSIRYCPTLDGTAATRLRGSLIGSTGQKVLKPSTNDISPKFLQYASVGIQGSGYEHGLKAAEMAVEKSLAGQNENLVRPNAFLAVIVVSDEEDDGIGLGMTDSYSGQNYVERGLTSFRYTDDHLINYLGSVKGSGNFSISAITGTRQANGQLCSAPHSRPLEEGTQYISAARKTGGIVQSICDTNWSTSLGSIGKDIAAQSAQIVLSHAPYESTIKVSVNGIASDKWTYSSGNNSIKFQAGFVPANGTSVKVDYLYAP